MECHKDDDAQEAGHDIVQLQRNSVQHLHVSDRVGTRCQTHKYPSAQRVTYHVPAEVGDPVGCGVDAADEVQVLGAGAALRDEEEDERGGDRRHGEDDGDGDEHIDPARLTAATSTNTHMFLAL